MYQDNGGWERENMDKGKWGMGKGKYLSGEMKDV
jgi:hypothetical protein